MEQKARAQGLSLRRAVAKRFFMTLAPAFIAGFLRGGTLRDCAVLANAMGALAVTQRGAGTRIPGRDHLLELLEDHPAARALAG